MTKIESNENELCNKISVSDNSLWSSYLNMDWLQWPENTPIIFSISKKWKISMNCWNIYTLWLDAKYEIILDQYTVKQRNDKTFVYFQNDKELEKHTGIEPSTFLFLIESEIKTQAEKLFNGEKVATIISD